MTTKTTIFTGFKVFALLLTLIFSISASALELKDAKRNGLVGETLTGYLAAVKSNPSADIKALIDDINSKRKARYEAIAKDIGKPISTVEQLAGQKAINKTLPGNYIQSVDGSWKTK